MYELPKIDVSGFKPIDLSVRLERAGSCVVIWIRYRAPDVCGDDKFATVGSSITIRESELRQDPMMWQGQLLQGLVTAMEHELMETIKVNGVRVFTPHPGPRVYSFPPNDKAASFPSSPEELAAQRASLARPR